MPKREIKIKKQDIILVEEKSVNIDKIEIIDISDKQVFEKIVAFVKIGNMSQRVVVFEGDDYPVGGIFSIDSDTFDNKIKEKLNIS